MLATLATVLAVASATTLPADPVTATSATLNGNVSGATTAHFEYGQTLPYESSTPAQAVTDGPVSAAVAVTANTTYHFRIVSDAGTGEDLTFTTPPNPMPPRIADQQSSAVTTSAAHVSATLDPNGSPTTYYFQYGRSTSYGNRTARLTATGDDPIAVSADVTGLRPYTRYHWRLYATNGVGKTPGRDHTFRTARVATALTLFADRGTVQWGRGVTLGGRVSGAGANGMTLALEQQRFPFDAGFAQVRTTRAGSDGGYLFSVDNVWELTRYRVVSQTQTPLASAVTTVRVKPRTSIKARNLSRKRARISGTIRPAVTGELSLQRRRASGRWVQVKHRTLTGAKTYSLKVWRQRRVDRAYRVVVLPVKGAYVKATSRKVVVSRRPARARAHRAAAG
jgi:hypothetical protein